MDDVSHDWFSRALTFSNVAVTSQEFFVVFSCMKSSRLMHLTNKQRDAFNLMTMSRFLHVAMTALAILFFLPTGCYGSDSPSLAPSFSLTPSQSPSLAPSPSPSASPSISTAPSTLAPTFPPVEMGKFEWDLDRIGEARLAFNEEFDMGEIMLDYNISLREATIALYQDDCTTSVPSTVAKATGIVTRTSPRHANLTVNIDVIQQNVTSSAIWTQVNASEALISMCCRVDLYNSQGVSVHFHEQIMRVSIGLLQGFQVGEVDLSRDPAEEESGDADVDFELIACHCNTNFECLVPTNLTQGSEVFLCVMSLAEGVEIVSIQELYLSQGSYSMTSIVDGQTDQFTVVSVIDEKAIIQIQMISLFFEQFNPDDVIAQGLALLGFTEDGGGRRFLRTTIRTHMVEHALEEEDVTFRIPLAVESSLTDNSGAGGQLGVLLSLLVVSVVAVLVVSS